ncbi:MAG TPA: DISARM system SNF2-like helicase DrmD, partial [Anaerolineae bacterium]|nr:DISARM system SNF2-like helicase DrmD [Anaerolineae bacterium]
LRMPRVNLLIADDVGLGKTIESGLVIQELMLRHRARTVLVVCPSSLQIQWRDQMRDKFGLEFRIVDAQLMKELRRQRGLHVNPWTHFPRLITSIDFIKRDRPTRLLREALPAEGEPTYPRHFDLLVVDEAHNIAPAGSGHYATDSLRTAAIRMLVPHFEHKLFLTATPHNGYPESFSALLELLDNQRFARTVRPSREQLAAVMVRRLKSELPPKWDGTPRFSERYIDLLEVEYSEAERRVHHVLQQYSRARQQGASGRAEEYATEFVLKLLKKRLFSSPAAFATTLERHCRSLQTATGRKRPLGVDSSIGILRRRVEELEVETADDDAYEADSVEVVDSASRLFHELTQDEAKLLADLRSYAESAASRADVKAAELVRWLRATVRPDGKWNDERVLIFTEYRATQKWLHELLAAEGLASEGRLMTLYGGMDSKSREQIKAAFQADPSVSSVRILLATDAASEGIDLQNHCHRLIHYEIPWNPNRMEQRNGRLDRHGQRSPQVLVYHFVGKGFDQHSERADVRPGDLDADLEFLMRAVIKVNTIREDLGKVGPVIASQVEEAMLGRRSRLDTRRAEEDAAEPRRVLRLERDLRAQISRLYAQLQETQRELRLSPENIQDVVSVALDLAGQPGLIEAHVPGVWPDPTGRREKCPVFHVPQLRGSWARCTEGLEHPHTHERRPIIFDHALLSGRDDVVLAHLNHRLVQMSLRLLRAEIWSAEGRRNLSRVSARLVPDTASDVPAVVAYGRVVVLGGDNQRLHEEIITAGGVIREGRFRRLNVGEVEALLSAALPTAAPEPVEKQLQSLWPQIATPLRRALEARERDRLRNLRSFLDERAERETGDITAILEELERTIRDELSAPEQAQLTLWTDIERQQRDRDRVNLRLRLERIPGEITQEVEAIRKRYANPSPRLFPVAVVFLVPEKLARASEGLR